MTHYLLDANHISPLVTLDHPVRERILQQISAGDTFYISVLALGEALYGFSVIARAKANQSHWQQLRSNFAFVDVSYTEVVQATMLRVALRKRGWQLELVDAILAIVALEGDMILLTTDHDFQAVPRLKTENWY